MFYATLVVSFTILILAHNCATPYPEPIRWKLFLTVGPAIVLAPACIFFFPTVSLFLLFTLGVSLLGWWGFRQRLKWFFVLSIPATLLAYGSCVMLSIIQSDTDRLRQMYPIESMEDRVPDPTWKNHSLISSFSSTERIDQGVEKTARYDGMRKLHLIQLHRGTLDQFTESMGFGVGRMISLKPTENNLKPRRDEAPPYQPGHMSSADTWLGSLNVVNNHFELSTLHESGVINFVNPEGFGIFEARNKVLGFVPHAFNEIPVSANAWKVETLELVGLVLHLEPTVYISNRLPAMDELKGAPTRPPDKFELASLEMLKKGDDLVTAETQDGGRMRMLGSIRNGTTCMKCHGGERGDLLGAFSYILSSK